MHKTVVNINIWEKYNSIILEELYNVLLNLSSDHGLLLINDENTYDNFINMMYNESDKTIIDYNLFPEYNIEKEKEHDYIYNQYIITDN